MADFADHPTAPTGPNCGPCGRITPATASTSLQVQPRNVARTHFGDGWKAVQIENTVPTVRRRPGPWNPQQTRPRSGSTSSSSRAASPSRPARNGTGHGREGAGHIQGDVLKSGQEHRRVYLLRSWSQQRTSGRARQVGADYDQFRNTSETQWMRFGACLLELDKQQGRGAIADL